MSAKWKAVYSRTQDCNLSYLCVMRNTWIFNFIQQNQLHKDCLNEVLLGMLLFNLLNAKGI